MQSAKRLTILIIYSSVGGNTLSYIYRSKQVDLLFADKALVKISSEYLDYTDIFSFDVIIELFQNTSINKYAIELI